MYSQNVRNLHLIHADFLTFDFGTQRFDQIIGNPPYFQITRDKEKYRKLFPILGGKFDIYILFILTSISLLKPNGILKFIIPSTFLSTDSYEPIRKYISTEFTILEILDFSNESQDWIHTSQKTIGIVIQNTKPIEQQFTLYLDSYCYIHSQKSIHILNDILKQSNGNTIGNLEFSIKTGEIVWNTVKNLLTDEPSYPLLIHNSYLKNNVLDFSNSTRPLYINVSNHLITEHVILVNRGNGNNGNFRITFAYFDPRIEHKSAIAENHVYKLYDNGKNQLEELYQSLCDPRTTLFIETCIGSGFITKKFIQMIPVFNF